MGSRQLGELLLRPSSLRSLSIAHTSSISRCTPVAWHSQRFLSTSAPFRASQPIGRPVPQTSRRPTPQSNTPIQEATQQSSPAEATLEDTTAAIDNLFRQSGIDRDFNRAPSPNKPQQPTSSDEFGAARRVFGSDFSAPRTDLRRKPLNWEDMTMPESLAPIDEQAMTPALRDEDIKYPRLNPSTGRTVTLDPAKGRDLVRGISMLSMLVSRNRVKADFNSQKFHERPGLKRKRLKSQRWRRNFQKGFKQVLGRVTELSRKGW